MHAAGGGKGAKGIVFKQTARGLAVDRQAMDLGYILRQFPDLDFGMDDFDHRLRVQKFVYLLQAFDIYLGYDYSWYLHGPYCTRLATVGYALSPLYDKVPYDRDMVFANPGVQKRFERFKKFIRGRENDNRFLEVAASLHILHRTTDMTRAGIFEKVAAKRGERVDEKYYNDTWAEMDQWKLLK